MRRRYTLVWSTVGIVLGGCAERNLTAPELASDLDPSFSQNGGGGPGAVYTMTNSAAGNAVLAFNRSRDGELGSPTAYATGGSGTGGGLGSQGALILTRNGRWLLAVNAGSDEISVFRVGSSGLTLTDRIASGGDRPISVTAHGRFVYVLHSGGVNNITGFTLSPGGELSPIAGSTRPLSTATPDPPQLEFDPHGRHIVVTEKATNRILTYEVRSDGTVAPAIVHASAGATPFGFTFSRNRLIVSEAFGGAANASATSSYILDDGDLDVVSSSVGTTETAACWAVVTNNGKFTYVTNTGSGTVSGYRVANDGSLTLLDDDGVTGTTGAGSSPVDAALSVNSKFLYVLNVGHRTISAFRVQADGSLTALAAVTGLPAGSVGLAAH